MHSARLLGSFVILLVLIPLLLATGCGKKAADAAKKDVAPVYATMETDKGTIELELLPEVAPKTVENFRLLAERGYYDGLTFHRVVRGFMIQGGDPKGTGQGGESAWGGTFEDEIDRTSLLYRGGYKRGSLAMANMGRNTNTSQFFIVQTDYPLPPDYTIFGRVIQGLDVVDAIVSVPTVRGLDGNMSKPVTPPVIRKVTIKTTPPAGAATEKK